MKICSKYFLLFILFFTLFNAHSQDLIQFKQKEKYKNLILDYSIKYKFSLDSTYFIIVEPNICPRCEALLPTISNSFKKQFGLKSSFKLILLVIGENKSSAVNFAKEYKSYFSELIIRLENVNELLLLNTGQLPFPLLAKFKDDGTFKFFKFLFGDLELNWTKFNNSQNDIECVKFNQKNDNDVFVFNKIQWSDSFKIDMKGFESGVYDFNLSNEKIFFISKNNRCIYKFDRKDSVIKLMDNTYIDSVIRSININLNEEKFLKFKNEGFFNPIYLSIQTLEGKMYCVGTLTKLETISIIDDKYSSHAIPVMFMLDENNGKLIAKNLKEIKHDEVFDDIYSIDHTKIVLSPNGLIYGYQKGIPVVGMSLSDTTDVMRYNPFSDSFYSSAPLFEIYKNGSGFLTLESLTNIFKEKKLGYTYTNSLIKIMDKKAYTSDGFRGYLLVYDKDWNITDTLYIKRHYKNIEDIINLKIIRNSGSHFFQMDKMIGSYVHDFYIQNDTIFYLEIISDFGPNIVNNSKGFIFSKFYKGKMNEVFVFDSKLHSNLNLQNSKLIQNKIVTIYFNSKNNQLWVYSKSI